MTKVLLVEDQKMAREYMAGRIAESGRYTIAAALANAALAEMACMREKIDLVLMDVCTEHDESGFTAAAQIRKHWPRMRIIIITSMADCSYLEKARKAGADSFWYKELDQDDLLNVMDRTMNGEPVWPAGTPAVQLGEAVSCEFTEKEIEVLRYLADALSYAEIADRMGVSVPAVRFHISNMLQKTGYTSKNKLAIDAINKRLIIPGF